MAELVCPSCDEVPPTHTDAERFCARCGTPLVHAGAPEHTPTEAQERARKILPQYARGALVRVVAARHQAEAEMIQNLLLEEGIPSLARRTGGFDVPDFLASGPRDILVPASAVEAARDILRLPSPVAPGLGGAVHEGTPPWVRALAAALAVVILALVAAGLFAALFG
jgi:hypothetical protein